MENHKRNKALFIGLGLIIAGVVIMLEKLNYQSDFIQTYLYRWESFLILIGFLLITVKRKIFGGTVVLAIGSYFLSRNLMLIPDNWVIWFFPALLILSGLAFLFVPDSPCCTKTK